MFVGTHPSMKLSDRDNTHSVRIESTSNWSTVRTLCGLYVVKLFSPHTETTIRIATYGCHHAKLLQFRTKRWN